MEREAAAAHECGWYGDGGPPQVSATTARTHQVLVEGENCRFFLPFAGQFEKARQLTASFSSWKHLPKPGKIELFSSSNNERRRTEGMAALEAGALGAGEGRVGWPSGSWAVVKTDFAGGLSK